MNKTLKEINQALIDLKTNVDRAADCIILAGYNVAKKEEAEKKYRQELDRLNTFMVTFK